MNQLPAAPLTPAQQSRLSGELYSQLGKQVKSYYASRNMGENSSVTLELAKELTCSVEYTLEVAGGYHPDEPLTQQLDRGQAILEQELEQTRILWRLVEATAPDYRSQCHWETVRQLGSFLDGYDLRHFAHQVPWEPDYPLLRPLPAELKGVRWAAGFLRCLWYENQILEGLTGGRALLDQAPPLYWEAPQNLCEQPLWNALGKTLLGEEPDPLDLTPEERERAEEILKHGEGKTILYRGMDSLSRILGLDEKGNAYARGAVESLWPRVEVALSRDGLGKLFW